MKRIDNALTKIGAWGIVSLLVVVPLLIDMNTLFPTGPASKNLFLAYGAALALFFLGARLLLFGRSISITPAQFALLLFGFYLFVRAIYDVRPDFALGVAAPHLGAVAVAVTLSTLHRDRRDLRPYLAALTLATVIAVIYAISQMLNYDLLFRLVYHRPGTWFNPTFEKERAVVFSTFGNPNYFAHFLGPVVLLGLAPALTARRRWLRTLWAIGLVVSLVVIFRTYNRGIWLGLLTGGMIWFLALVARRGGVLRPRCPEIVEGSKGYRRAYSPRICGDPFFKGNSSPPLAGGDSGGGAFSTSEKPTGDKSKGMNSGSNNSKLKSVIIVLLVLGVLALLLLRLPVIEPLVRRFRTALLLRDTSVRSRLLFWFIALLMWHAHPWIGIGMGRYDPRFFDELLALAQSPSGDTLRNLTEKMVSLRAVYAHNDYVQILSEWGAVGFGLFLLVALLVLGAAIRVAHRDYRRSKSVAFLGIGFLAAYGSFLVQLLYDFPLHLPASELLFFFLIGGILILEKESGSEVTAWRVRNRGVCAALGLALLVPLAWSLPRLSAKFSASHHLYHGQNNARAGENAIADREYEIATQLDPENGEISYYRALNFATRDDTIRQAIDLYPQSLETYQTSAYYYYLGIAYSAENDYSRAMQCLRKLRDINPNLKGANYALGLCYFRNPYGPEYKQAAESFAREVQKYPDDLYSWLYLGASKLYLQDVYGARDAYWKAIEVHPTNIEANEQLGDIYARPGSLFNAEIALQYYQKAIQVAIGRRDGRKVAQLRNKIETIQRKLPHQEVPHPPNPLSQ